MGGEGVEPAFRRDTYQSCRWALAILAHDQVSPRGRGEVVGIYIDDDFVRDGLVHTGEMQPIARLGYMQYAVVRPENVFELNRPELTEDGMVKNPAPGTWDGQYR